MYKRTCTSTHFISAGCARVKTKNIAVPANVHQELMDTFIYGLSSMILIFPSWIDI